MRHLVTLFSLFAACAHGQVLINEVLFHPDPASEDASKAQPWLELFNAGTDPVDLSGWKVTGADGITGASARSLPGATLPAGGYLVVHFAPGQNQLDFTNGSGDFYTGDSAANAYWKVEADEAALYSPKGIADFINWARSTTPYRPGKAHDDAVAAAIWTRGAVLVHDRIGLDRLELLRSVLPGDSIGRNATATDANQPSDFDAHGGPSGLGPTQGRRNLTIAPIVDISDTVQAARARARPRADAVKRKWTVLLFMSADNNTEQWFFDNLKLVQQAGGSTAEVNFVTMYDSQTIAAATYRGLIGSPRIDAQLGLSAPGGISIGERNMGDPQELQGFIEWAKQNYPADKYALILGSHGAGWKGFGPDNSSPGTRSGADWLYMGELSTALAGQSFEWIAFHACFMGAVEVAHQLQPFARYLMASEEVAHADDFPYAAMAQHLAANPDWDALQSIGDIHAEYVKLSKVNDPQLYTISVMDLARVPDLTVNIRAWADLLAPGMSLFQQRDDPNDNVQVLTKKQLDPVEKFSDTNFIDLSHFTSLMIRSGVPPCLLTPAPSIVDIIANRVVVRESHGPSHPNAHGVHIYFPRRRVVDPLAAPNADGQSYDYPSTRTFDGSSPRAHYGLLADQLPLKSLDPETGEDFEIGNVGAGGVVWPLPQSPNFKFPNDTGWRKVLDRYYHPTADNRILPVVVSGATINPTSSGGGACANPSDSITVPVGTTVTFSAAGSSDADQQTGVLPTYYFWDQDDKVPCSGACIPPFSVPPGTDAALASNDNEDADQDIANTLLDDKDASGPRFSRPCSAPGTFVVTLMTWDDDHLFAFHNTLPNASYVHPQTARHPATVSCTAAPPPAGTCPNSGTMITTETVASDPFVSAMFVGLTGGMVNFTRSGPQGTQVTLSSPTTQLVPGTGTFDPAQCSLMVTGTSTGPIAGFQNVVAQYDLKIGGSNFNTVTGTYKVGLNNTLNREPQPVTYNVTGTVINAK